MFFLLYFQFFHRTLLLAKYVFFAKVINNSMALYIFILFLFFTQKGHFQQLRARNKLQAIYKNKISLAKDALQ